MEKEKSYSRFETVKNDNLRAPSAKIYRNLSANSQDFHNKSYDVGLEPCDGDELSAAYKRYEALLSKYSKIKESKRKLEERLSEEANKFQNIKQKQESLGIVCQLEIKPFKQIKKSEINQFIQENDTVNHDKILNKNYKIKYFQLYSDYNNMFELYKKNKSANKQDFTIKRLTDENKLLKEDNILLLEQIKKLVHQIDNLTESEKKYNFDKYNNLKKNDKKKLIIEKDLIIKNQFSIIINKDFELEKLKTEIKQLRLRKLD